MQISLAITIIYKAQTLFRLASHKNNFVSTSKDTIQSTIQRHFYFLSRFVLKKKKKPNRICLALLISVLREK